MTIPDALITTIFGPLLLALAVAFGIVSGRARKVEAVK